MTLVEVLVVVAIIALISGGVGLAVMKFWGPTQEKTTATNARVIRHAVRAWWLDRGSGGCPAIQELVATGALDRDSPKHDAWGETWRIECANDDVTVISAGPDRQLGTADDIRVPPV